MDLTGLPREEINDMIRAGESELARRQTQDTFYRELAELQAKYRGALSIQPMGFWPWQESEYPLDAPGVGDTVKADKRYFRSLLPCNMFHPDTAGYRQITRNGEPRTWVEPTRDHDGYAKGERCVSSGVTYESVCDQNVMPPGTDSQYWTVVDLSEE